MRVSQGTTMDEVQESLTPDQAAKFRSVLDNRAREASSISSYEDAQESLHKSVKRALDAGVPVALIAERLDVTRARVYQMRDGSR